MDFGCSNLVTGTGRGSMAVPTGPRCKETAEQKHLTASEVEAKVS